MVQLALPALTSTEFEAALRRAYPVIFQRLASRYLDQQLAEEVAWDSLTRAFEVWRDNPHYFDDRNLTEWSSQLAGWRALDQLRKRNRHVSLLGDPFEEDQTHPRVGRYQVYLSRQEQAERREQLRQLVWESLQLLDAAERDLLCASYYDNQSDQEIGARLYDEGTATARGLRVWRRRQKAQAHLRQRLRDAGYEPEVQDTSAGQAL